MKCNTYNFTAISNPVLKFSIYSTTIFSKTCLKSVDRRRRKWLVPNIIRSLCNRFIFSFNYYKERNFILSFHHDNARSDTAQTLNKIIGIKFSVVTYWNSVQHRKVYV